MRLGAVQAACQTTIVLISQHTTVPIFNSRRFIAPQLEHEEQNTGRALARLRQLEVALQLLVGHPGKGATRPTCRHYVKRIGDAKGSLAPLKAQRP